MAKKARMQKRKELKGKTRRIKVEAKAVRKKFMKKRNIVIKSFLNSDSEVSFHPQKKNFILCWRLHLKMISSLFAFQKPNDKFLTQLCLSPFFLHFFIHLLINFLCFFRLLQLFKTARYESFCT